MNRSRIVIAGTSSGAGKTTFTIGLMAAFIKLGKTVQGYKVGPDYIDPSYHTSVTGRPSRNLDSWMLGEDSVREIFYRSSGDADLSIIEGVMGLFDGKDPLSNAGSTADLSAILAAPIILVINAASMARSAAAVVLGFQKFAPSIKIAGVLVNQVGSAGHYQLVKAAIEKECGIPALGYLTKNREIDLPERHLGLIPAIERGEQSSIFDTLAEEIGKTVDLKAILAIASQAQDMPELTAKIFTGTKKESEITIAVAKDRVFNFYYPENLELLEWQGARVKFFSPFAGESIPDEADGLYIGGGFPEEYAGELSLNQEMLADFRKRITDGLPTFAECGGFMFLTESITDREGCTHSMVGIIPASVKMQSRLAALGYREVRALKDSFLLAEGERIRGHEFHYSTVEYHSDVVPFAYEIDGNKGVKKDGYCAKNLIAAYTHLHFGSNPHVVERFITACTEYRAMRLT